MAPRKIIFDTDPGQDDMAAILLALGSPEEIEVLGIVAVAGNVPLSHTSRNALRICELAGRSDIPVFAGSDQPMGRKLVTAEHVHGKTGLDGPDLPEPKMTLQARPGIDYLIETLRASAKDEITLVTLGPLTDIGLALTRAPEIAGKIREIVMMAGAYFEVGNITPTAEFNVYVDPKAAELVLKSGVPVTMMPLDVTHRVLVTPARMERLFKLGNRSGKALAEALTFSRTFDINKYGWDGAPLHDPTTIAYLLRPSLFQGREINVSIETESELTMGMTVADYWRVTQRPRNVRYMRDIDADGFFALLCERIGRLP
ncbi:MAG TPA: nucleoside hydrolase [Dongiaceae bacterium]|jgi:purine nucleosidase|nr:nucleoside hydrolase [Dongiaceae bacterium]